MFGWKKRRHAQLSRKRPARHANRARLCFENLETRTLLSAGIVNGHFLDNPVSSTALVVIDQSHADQTHQSHQALSDVVSLDGYTKLLAGKHQIPWEKLFPENPDPLGLNFVGPVQRVERQTDSLLSREMNFLFHQEVAFLNSLIRLENSFGFWNDLLAPAGSIGSASATDANGATGTIKVNPSDLGQPVNLNSNLGGTITTQPLILEINPSVQIRVDITPGSNEIHTQITDPGTSGDNATNSQGNLTQNQTPANPNSGSSAGNTRGGTTSLEARNSNGSRGGALTNSSSNGATVSNGSSTQNGTLADTIRNSVNDGTRTAPTTTVSGPAVTAPVGPQTTAQATVPAATTTPVTPAQTVLVQDTAKPSAPFEQIISTKEGYKTANGEEATPANQRNNRDQQEAQALGFEETGVLAVLDGTDGAEEASLLRHQSDAFFMDGRAMEMEERDLLSTATRALAGAAVVLGGFFGAQVKQTEERKRRHSGLGSWWKKFRS